MRKEQILGSQTAKNGFLNEDDIVEKFNNWNSDEDAQKLYLKFSILLQIKVLVKGSPLNKTITPLGFIILFSCSHIKSNGIILSHLHCVVP